MPTYLASIRSDGRPLDLADVAEFIAALAVAGVPATTPLLFDDADTLGDELGSQPAVVVSAQVTEGQVAAMPDNVEITADPVHLDALQEV